MRPWLTVPTQISLTAVTCAAIVMHVALHFARISAAEPPVPKDAVTTPDVLVGKLVDARGQSLAEATVSAIDRRRYALAEPVQTKSDAAGRFQIESPGAYETGRVATVFVETKAGLHYEVNLRVTQGVVEVRVPTLVNPPAAAPRIVRPGELAGVVVDEVGNPIADVEVGYRAKTNEDGVFRIRGAGGKLKVKFRKAGYSPEAVMHQPTGVSGWVIVLGRETYLEGTVRDEEGQPVAGVKVRAQQGPKFAMGWPESIRSETTTDQAGRYRLYLQPDEYEVRVRAPEVGVAIAAEHPVGRGPNTLDFTLDAGIAFRAVVVDATSGEPVSDVQLANEDQPDVEGTSTAEGLLLIRALPAGKALFAVKAPGYARWWSEDCGIHLFRRHMEFDRPKWQRNFNSLDFDMRQGMPVAKIEVERAVRVRGRVLDPDGKPVAGARVATTLSGSGGTLSGDDRFDVFTAGDGHFEMSIPASNTDEYNLMAHDGKVGQWRSWANGVLPPISTTPGQSIDNVELRLSRPATIRGRVVDQNGKPVPRIEVQAQATDGRENMIYDRTTKTKSDGTFELTHLRATEQQIQAGRTFRQANPSIKRITASAEQVVEGLELVAPPAEERPDEPFITLELPAVAPKKQAGGGARK